MAAEQYDKLVAALFRQNQFAIKYDLDAMRAAVAACGLQRIARRVVLVGGTNGKGRTAAHLNNLAVAAGWRTGLYTSPHLIDFRERIRLDGAPVSKQQLVHAGQELFQRFSGQNQPAEGTRPLSYFELTTLIAARLFAEQTSLDLAILEVGLGGRLDATNVFERDAVIVTGIGLDHVQWLGPTLPQIAGEKLGIVQSGLPVHVHRSSPGAELLLRGAEQRGAVVHPAAGLDASPRGLARDLAEQTFHSLGGELGATRLNEEAAALVWPGRQMQRQEPGVHWWIDGAHNRQATEACARWLAETGPTRTWNAIVGVSPDRDACELLEPLLPLIDRWVAVASTSGKATPTNTLHHALKEHAVVEERESPAAAVEHARAQGGNWLVVGSLYVVGDALAAMGLTADDLSLRAESAVNSAV